MVKEYNQIPNRQSKPQIDSKARSNILLKALSGSFHITPKCGIGFHPKGSNNIIGTSFSYDIDSWGRTILDLTMFGIGNANPGGIALMLAYEKKIRNISLQSGIVIMSTFWKDASKWDGTDSNDGNNSDPFSLHASPHAVFSPG